MAYIPFSYAPMEADTNREYRYTLPLGGVKLSEKDEGTVDGAASRMSNMDVLENSIETRGKVTAATPALDYNGNSLHSITRNAFCEKIILHSGTCLMGYSLGDEAVTVIYDGLPDRHSIMCQFMSKLYIYCDSRVFSLDDNMNLTEELPHVPLVFDEVNDDGETATVNDNLNMCAPIVRARYSLFTSKERYIFRFPKEADLEKPFFAYVNGVEISSDRYTLDSKYIIFNYDLQYNSDIVELVYYLKNPADAGYEFFIENCKIAESYGGNVNSGTRIFFAGNPDKKGYYCKSKLQNPLYVSKDEFEVIGDGCDDITAMKKMYGDLIIFTEKTVYRMSYQQSADLPYFSVREIGNGVGCDCPESVCLIDNRVVFLNSGKGVFIVDSTEQTGEQNIKPLSGNINYGKGAGLLENSSENLTNCFGIDYGRKYMMCVGEKVYIWDYDKSAFRDSASYAASQGRLIWYMYENMSCDSLFELSGKLLAFSKDGHTFGVFDEDSKNDVMSFFSSGKIDVSGSHDKKHITGMEMILYAYGDGKIDFTFYADGQEYCKKQMNVLSGKTMHIKLRLPAKTLYSFGFDVLAHTGVRIEKTLFRYKIV